MTDHEIQTMRDQIATEAEKDPLDGGVPNDGGDGVMRYPTDPSGMAVDPEMDAGDRAALAVGIPPEADGKGWEPPEQEPEPQEDEFDKSMTVKRRK